MALINLLIIVHLKARFLYSLYFNLIINEVQKHIKTVQ